MAIDFSESFKRGNFAPLDVSYVMGSISELHDYLSGAAYVATPFDPAATKGMPYAGQVVAVLNGTETPDVYVIHVVPSGTAGAHEHPFDNQHYAYAPIRGSGGAAGADVR